MLEKLNEKIRYTRQHKKYLRKLRPFIGGEWEKKDGEMKSLKRHIRSVLKRFQQNKCAYCGLPLDETSGSEIEHIAPKGGAVYPKYKEFTFTPFNLVLSCHLCNNPVKKGKKDTIVNLNSNYKVCEFNIVHPYFDDPNHHFDWVPNGKEVLISYKSTKGEKSIEIFKLDDNAHNEARARILLYDYFKTEPDIEELLKKALDYRGSL
ncbi:retron system putative HNH endonuclease [Priestia megaterium]|uniref:retron system putative HNH endonuclease n=1 Tax=Priestia megaterium TaxID=1404 RepID=UPI001AE043C4|nr:retron system putative HNH endonuclease [Priestia megaterium]